MEIKLKVDSRDLNFHQKFGATIIFPPEANYDSAIQDVVQPPGDVQCTAITTCGIADDQDKTVYDYKNLFNRIPHENDGAQPRDALGEAVKNGLLPVTQSVFVKNWSSYWRCDTGSMDAFDNVRSAMQIALSPVGIATAWYGNWFGVNVLPVGNSVIGYHMYQCEGWKQINGVPMLIIEAWLGYKLYMPRETFNKAVAGWGCGAWVLSTSLIDTKKNRTTYEYITDVLKNIWLKIIPSIRQIISELQQQKDMTPIIKDKIPEKIVQWANAIKQWEGAKESINNPGNLKYSSLTASWGASKGYQASDGGYIAKFDTYEEGFAALCNFLILGCKDELKAFHHARTFQTFMQVYAGNPPLNYIRGVASLLGCSLTTDIKVFLL